MLDRVLGQQTGVVGGAAGDDEDFVDLTQFLVAEPLLVEHDAAVDEVAEQRLGHRGGLFGDLLEHEALVSALLGGGQIPVDVEIAGIGGIVVTVEIGDAIPVSGDDHRLVLAEFDCLPGEFDERRDVRAQEHLAITDADDKWGGASRRDDGAGVVGVGEHHGEVTLEAAQDGQRRCDEIPLGRAVVVFAGEEMHGDLGVGVAGELDSF